MNLRPRLALVTGALVLLGMVLGLTMTYWGLLNLRIVNLDNENRLLANLVFESALMRDAEPIRIPGFVSGYLTGERATSAAQVYVDGQLIWSAGTINAPRPLDPERVLAGSGAHTVLEWRVYTHRDDELGALVQVGRPLQGLREVLGPFPELAVAVTLVITALTGALAWAIAGLALRPLRRLSDAAERFDDAEDVPLIPGSDEPARLARSFAGLLSRLRADRERERRFLAYAAHELRTPLSALRAGLESARTGRVALTPEMVARLHREATRLEGLAQNLLALSTAEAGDAVAERLDLQRIAADAYDRYLPLAVEKGLALELEGIAAPVAGDGRLLDQALSNLISNALRATSAGAITIRTGREDGIAVLEVRDTGAGYRAPPDGRGLGLRVVRAVAEVHGGGFSIAADGAAGGTRARIWLPIAGGGEPLRTRA